MGSASRGNAAEAAVLHALVKRGLDVFVPFGSGHPFDLAVYVPDTGFLRVQCKRGWALRGCIVFNAYSTDHGSGTRGYAGLADLFGVYFPPSEDVFLTPIDAVAASEGAPPFRAAAEQPAEANSDGRRVRDQRLDR
jgi:hypothetical protein